MQNVVNSVCNASRPTLRSMYNSHPQLCASKVVVTCTCVPAAGDTRQHVSELEAWDLPPPTRRVQPQTSQPQSMPAGSTAAQVQRAQQVTRPNTVSGRQGTQRGAVASLQPQRPAGAQPAAPSSKPAAQAQQQRGGPGAAAAKAAPSAAGAAKSAAPAAAGRAATSGRMMPPPSRPAAKRQPVQRPDAHASQQQPASADQPRAGTRLPSALAAKAARPASASVAAAPPGSARQRARRALAAPGSRAPVPRPGRPAPPAWPSSSQAAASNTTDPR